MTVLALATTGTPRPPPELVTYRARRCFRTVLPHITAPSREKSIRRTLALVWYADRRARTPQPRRPRRNRP